MRPIFPTTSLIRLLPQALIVLGIFPWFSRKFLQRAVGGREDGGVLGGVVEAGGDGGDVAGEAGEDVDGAVGGDDIGDGEVGSFVGIIEIGIGIGGWGVGAGEEDVGNFVH